MSRSLRKTPIMGIAGSSDKRDKTIANRAFRRAVKLAIIGDKQVLPVIREVSDVWSFSKDGKQYFSDPIYLRK